jgi:hypothetical protein
MKTKTTAGILEDRKVNVKVKLALLWAALMFLYIYNDTYGLSGFHDPHVPDIESPGESINEYHRRHFPCPCPYRYAVCGRGRDLVLLEVL